MRSGTSSLREMKPDPIARARAARGAAPTSRHRDNYVVTRSRPYPRQGQLGQHAVLPLPQIQLKLQADDAGVGLDIAEAEVGVLAILDLGDTALAAAELGGHL